MANPNLPIVNAGTKYANGCILAWVSNTVLSLTVGAARDNRDENDIILGSVLTPSLNIGATINAALIGVANGLDAGALAANSDYAVYIIGDSTGNSPVAGLISTNFAQPILPRGYDIFRRVGAAMTDGSAHFLKWFQYGRSLTRTYYYDAPIVVLTAGAATTFTAVDLNSALPNVGPYEVYFQAAYTPGAATNVAEFINGLSTATSGSIKIGTGVAVAQTIPFWIGAAAIPGLPSIKYKVTAGDALTLSVIGYKDELSAPQ